MPPRLHPDSLLVPATLWFHSLQVVPVKNRFSNPTKEQKGQYRPRKDVVNRYQVRALREGCHERRKVQVGVSSREKKKTNRNLMRATTKSKSRTRTVSNGCVSGGEVNRDV